MKIIWILALCVLLTGCQLAPESNLEVLQEKDMRIESLEKENDDLKAVLETEKIEIDELQTELEGIRQELENKNRAEDLFPLLSNHALEFVRAHTSGDLEAIQGLVSDGIAVEGRDGKIIALWDMEDRQIEWTLWDGEAQKVYRDMVIQGYGQLPDGTMMIHIREFYTMDEETVSPPTFLNLHYREEASGWKVVYFEFDV